MSTPADPRDADTGPDFVRRCLAAQQDTFDGWVSFADKPTASQAAARMYQTGEVDEADCIEGEEPVCYENGITRFKWNPLDGWRLDIEDLANHGHLLGLVRKAYGHGPARDVSIERDDDGRYCLAVRVLSGGIWRYDTAVHDSWDGLRRTHATLADLARDTYGLALVAALLAAPAPKLTRESILALAYARVLATGCERPGQALFNVLVEQLPELAEQIRGTDSDPFYIERGGAQWDRALAEIDRYLAASSKAGEP